MVVQLTQVDTLDKGYGAQFAFASDGTTWAAASPGTAHLWDGDVLRQTVSIPGYRQGPAVIDADTKTLRLGSWEIDVTSGDATEQTIDPQLLVAHLDWSLSADPRSFGAHALAPTPNGKRLIMATTFTPSRLLGDTAEYEGPRGQVLLFDVTRRALIAVLEEDTGPSTTRVLAADATRVAAAAEGIRLWDATTAKLLAEDATDMPMRTDLRFDRDGSLLASSRVDGSVEVRATSDLSIVSVWDAHPSAARAVAFHPSRPLLATGGEDQQLKVWALEGGSPELVAWHFLDDGITGLGFHPFGEHLLVATDDDEIVVVNISTNISA
ncbi:MAG: Anaphase-promoting complex subunit 4 domain [Acidimicrobiaceae bacterium]|jgi:WD40 repeat protein